MDENVTKDEKEKKFLLVQQAAGGKKKTAAAEESDGKIEAVTAIDKQGNIKTVKPTAKNTSKLLDINTNDSALEAFLKKFMEQAENPSHTGVFLVTKEILDKLIKCNFNQQELEKYRIDPTEELQKQQQRQKQENETSQTFQAKDAEKIIPAEELQSRGQQGQQERQEQQGQEQKPEGEESQAFRPMDIEKIDRADMERKGIRMEAIEPHLKAMSYGHKSPALVEMSPELTPGGKRVPTTGRVSFEEQPDGSLRVIPHYRQDNPALDIPIYEVLLDEKTKENLLKTGHAGKTIDMELTPGLKEPCYVTLDKLTNSVEVLPVSAIQPIEKIKGVELTGGQQSDLASGRRILVEGMTSRSGRLFDGYIQINASDRKIEFTYEGLDRKRYTQENKETGQRQTTERQTTEKPVARQTAAPGGEERQLFIPKKLLGVELDNMQVERLKEGKPAYIKGMAKDAQGEPFNAWVKPNYEKGKFDFYKYNPDYVRRQGGEVKPAAENKTQVAVNSHGKTNEATKYLKVPLRQGQQRPTENQQQQQNNRKIVKKSAGYKM